MSIATRQEPELAKAQKNRVFPPKSGKEREKGEPKKGHSFRAPDDVTEWLKAMEAAEHDKTEVIVTALRVGRDVAKRIGERWYEIEYRARRKNLQPGEMLAQLALDAIAADEAAGTPKPHKK